MAKFVTNNNLPAIALNGCTAPGPCASYWRFVGIEVTNTAGIRVSNKLVDFSGGNHMILDRSIIHGQDDPTFNQTSEVQGGVNFNGSYLAVIDSWVYNTFCANAPTGATCVDSQGVSGGTGPYPQKAQKILNNLVASSGESWFWGGGQQAHLTNASNPDGVSTDIEVRKNFSFKPLSWMLAICGGTCTGNKWDPKNLGETKATNRSLWEANVEQNSWTGWQSDQFGNANLVTPKNQSSKANGTGTVAVDSAFTDNKHIVVTGGTFNCELDLRTDAGYAAICPSIVAFPGLPGTYTKPCPPAGCRVTIGGATYHGQTVTDSTHMVLAEVLTTPGVQTSYCKRGLNPFAVVRNHTMRYNLIRHVTDVYEILTGESDCGDDALGVHSVSVHDNIAYDVDATFWTNSLNPCCNTGWVVKLESATTSAAAVPSEITVNHNTAALISFGGHNQGLANWFDQKAIPVYFPNIQFLNNITAASLGIAQGGGGYITGGQYGGANLLACSGHAAGSGCTYDIRKNLVLTGLWTSQGNDSPNIQSAGGTAVDSCTSSGTTTSGSAAACDRNVGFNGYSSVFTAWDPNGVGPFDLSLPAGSPYLLQGTDNKNLGADVPGTTAKLIGSDLNSTVTYAALSITTTSLPNGTLGQTYSQQLAASTGASPFKAWSLTAGSLPAGLTLGRNGLISGTPTAVGSSFTVRAVDASHQTATKSLSITIN